MMNYISHLSVFLILLLLVSHSEAQDTQFQPDKPGRFILLNNLNKCPGKDIPSITKNLTVITGWIQKHDSVFDPPIGFDASVSLSGNLCDKITSANAYGIASRISFSFHYFYFEKGILKSATDWAAHDTEFNLNQPTINLTTQFDEPGFQTGDSPQLEKPLGQSLEKLNSYYTVAPVIKEIAPGVRLFAGDCVLVFNPDRPYVWIPVTVKEIMEAMLTYYKLKQEIDSIRYEAALIEWAKLNFKPDQATRPNMYNIMKKEFDNFTQDELNQPAYKNPQSGISGINIHGEGRQVVRFNAQCWDHSLSTSAIQFISLDYKPQSAAEMEEFKHNNGGLVDYVGLYMNSLPVEKMRELIQMK